MTWHRYPCASDLSGLGRDGRRGSGVHARADGSRRTVTFTAGEYAINEPGARHTAHVEKSATAVFIAAGVGTMRRPR